MNIYELRPFKARNAEDFELSAILDIFVSPIVDAKNPFDYENSIVKGAMGSGKSIFLKANYAYYLYSIIPSLLAGEPVVLPVLIKLSDFQHIKEPHEIYNAIIVQVMKELAGLYQQLSSADRLIQLHHGMRSLPQGIVAPSRSGKVLEDILKLTADEYKETVTSEIGAKGSITHQFIELGTDFKKTAVKEVQQKRSPGIGDIHDAYAHLLGTFNGSLLLLIDEAGSLDKSFFKDGEHTSLFETLMNQFRTAEYLRTKIAVYPNSCSDILVETRYGDTVPLTENVDDELGYFKFRERALSIIDKYIFTVSDGSMKMHDVFVLNLSPRAIGDPLEQVIYASGGNVRRLLHILDQCMLEAYSQHKGAGKVNHDNILSALRKHSSEAESIHTGLERDFLDVLANTCRARSTFRFQFPYKSPILSKYTTKSEEHNVLTVSTAGSGRRGTTYQFDYAFCINHDIPTHYIKDTEKIDKSRSRETGTWITRIAQISEELIEHAKIPGKIEGVLEFVKGDRGFVKSDDGQDYFVARHNFIEADREKPLIEGKRIRYYPIRYDGSNIAVAVEML